MKKLLSVLTMIAVSASVSFAAPSRKPAPKKPAKKTAVKPAPKPVVVLTPREQLYQQVGVSALWIEDGRLLPRAQQLRELVLSAGEHGLDPAAYWTPRHDELLRTASAENAETVEAELTGVLLKYATDLSTGRLSDPTKLGDDVKMKRQPLNIARVANALKAIVDLRQSFEAVAPQWPGYRELKAALARFRSLTDAEFPAIAIPRRDPKLNEKGAVFAAVKTRLRTLGYDVSNVDPVYDKELRDLVKTYVVDHALKGASDLRRSGPFWRHLSASASARATQIKLQMEKLRWLPATPDDRFLFVNLAFQRLNVWENKQVVMTMRTINGRVERKSPTLIDKIVNVELNPDWTVPVRLIVEDKIPAIMADPSYLERGGFQVFDRRGRELSDWEIDWYSITKQNAWQISIRQRPGLGNALGVMKFNLTNPYAIYLHDTNERHLFGENHRLISSGCVRLERPTDLSAYLLRDHPQWSDRRAVEAELATTQFADYWVRRLEYPIKLVRPVPVYLMSLTVEVDSRGVVKFAGDYYEQDTRLYQALR